MRCPRCEFNNMPGLDRCFKCGSALRVAEEVEIEPPRMARWKGPIRFLFRKLREYKLWGRGSIWTWPEKVFDKLPSWLKPEVLSKDVMWATLLSLVPGVGHWAQGRFKAIRWYVMGWLVVFGGALFLWGTTWGEVCFGLTIALHAWIMFHAGLLGEVGGFFRRVFVLLVLLVVMLLVYRGVGSVVFGSIDTGYAVMAYPGYGVERRDLLLGRPLEEETEVRSGELVLVEVQAVRGRGGLAVAQVIAVAGDRVEIQEGAFWVNGARLSVDNYPVPDWMQVKTFSERVPEGRYFVATQYNVNYRRGVNMNDYISRLCILKRERIMSRMFMIWTPLGRRGFLDELELEERE